MSSRIMDWIGRLGFLRAILIVAGLQTLALGYIVYQRVNLLQNGQELVTKVVPIDPRDLFRGDYVILGYDFARQIKVDAQLRTGQAIYVTLRQKAETNAWEAVSAAPEYPSDKSDGDQVLYGTVRRLNLRTVDGQSTRTVDVDFGIERFFVPEGTGKPIEKAVLEKQVDAVLAVGPGGAVAIKELRIDGTSVAKEPVL